MKSKSLIPTAILVVLSFIGNQVSAQGDLPSGSVDIVKNFDARLEDTDKINTSPRMQESERQDRKFRYSLIPSTVKLDHKLPEIRPLAMPAEKMPEFSRGFIRLGYGWPSSPYAEGGYHLNPIQPLEMLIHARHHSANDKRYENQRFMDNDFGVKGTYYFDQGFALGAQVNYSLDDYYFYGYNQADTSFSRQYAQRRYNTLDGGLRFFNTNGNDNDLSYFAHMNFYNHRDNFEAKENGTLIHLGVKKFLGGSHPIFAEVITDLSTYEDTTIQKLNNFFFIPGGAFNTDAFSLRAAVRISSFQDEFYFFPDINIRVRLLENALSLYAGWDGNFHKNNFRNLTAYNPFLRPILPEINNARFFDYYGGLSGNAGEWNYELRGGYKTVDNLALFIQDPTDKIPTRFLTLYDQVNIIYAKTSLHTTIMKQFTLGLQATYNHFDPKTAEKAWQLPELEANLNLSYRTTNNKFQFRSDIYFMNGIPFLNDDLESDRLNTLFDLSFGIDYMITKNIGLFAMANNLASIRWQRWFNYPTFGINALGGITLKF